jgi:hypothetical protein
MKSIIKSSHRGISPQAVALAAAVFLTLLASVFVGIGYAIHAVFGL